MKTNKKIKTPQRGVGRKKKSGARQQLRKVKVREKKVKLKGKVREKIKRENNGETKQLLREMDLHQEKHSRTGFRVPPLYHQYIKLLGKKMRGSQDYGQDLSESAVVIRLVSDKCRELRIFS